MYETNFFMTHEELKAYLEAEYGGYSLFEPEYYDEGIVGITDNGNVVYSYEKLAEALMKHDEMTYEDAVDWLDYNTVRSVPYMGEYKPVILLSVYDFEDEWLVGIDPNGRPIYSSDNIPQEPVRHEYFENYGFNDKDNPVQPEPIIMNQLQIF